MISKSNISSSLMTMTFVLSVIVGVNIQSVPAHAAAAICDSNSCVDEIDRLYISNDGRVYVSIEDRSQAATKLNCTLVGGWYFTLLPGHPSFSQMYDTLLNAKSRSTGVGRNRVYFRMVDNSPICEIAYIYVDWPN